MTIDDEPWFVGKDVAECLGYSNPNEAIQDHVDEEDKFIRSTRGSEVLKLFTSLKDMQSKLGRQDNWFINESGLYSLIMRSKLPSAKEFKRWVTSEVLPSIRKNNMFVTDKLLDNPEFAIKTFERLRDERNARIAAEEKVSFLTPKAEFYDHVVDSKSLLNVGQAAKVLNVKGIGRNNMFKVLREKGVLQYDNVPYQRFVSSGYFEVKEREVEINGICTVKVTTYITQKGLDWIRKMFTKAVLA